MSLALADGVFTFATDAGVFAYEQVDAGTRLLLREAPPPVVSGDIADIGCGYGAIAVVAARRSPDRTVWAIDVNDRALALAADNAQKAGCPRVRPVRPEAIPADVRLAAIYSNPPSKWARQSSMDSSPNG